MSASARALARRQGRRLTDRGRNLRLPIKTMSRYWLGRCGWVGVLAASIAMTVACGKASDDPPGPSAAGSGSGLEIQTADDFIAQFVSNYCQSIADCCQRLGFPTTDCETTLRGQLDPQLQSSSSNPKLHFNAAVGVTCIKAYTAALRACTDHDLFAKLEDTCEPLFEGTVAVGEACAKNLECAAPAGGAASCSAGVCVAAQKPNTSRRQLGESCAGTCLQSPRDTYCYVDGNADPKGGGGSCWLEDGVACANGTCVAAPKAGEACTSQAFCARDAHCVSGVCVGNLSNGACSQDASVYCPLFATAYSACASRSKRTATLAMRGANASAANATRTVAGRGALLRPPAASARSTIDWPCPRPLSRCPTQVNDRARLEACPLPASEERVRANPARSPRSAEYCVPWPSRALLRDRAEARS